MTGYVKNNGHNAVGWNKIFKLDTWYVDNQLLWLNIKILIKAVKKVITKDNIIADGLTI